MVGAPGSGKTAALLDLKECLHCPYVNVNLALSERLLEVPISERAMRAAEILDDMVDLSAGIVLLDNLELLFDIELRLHPLTWLRRVSRNRTVVAAWGGNVEGSFVTYAEQGHREYRRDWAGDILVVSSVAAYQS